MQKLLLAVPLMLAFCATFCAAEEVTLKGKVTCAKCDLKVEAACKTVLVVKDNGKDVVYYFDADGGKKHHKEICQAPTDGTVTGEVGMDGDKHTIKVSKVDYTK